MGTQIRYVELISNLQYVSQMLILSGQVFYQLIRFLPVFINLGLGSLEGLLLSLCQLPQLRILRFELEVLRGCELELASNKVLLM